MREGGVSIGPEDVLAGYAAAASELIPRYEALSTAEVLAPVAQWLPVLPAHVLDVGAGTGRDAAWLAERGHRIVAVEPVAALRSAGMALHPSAAIDWVDDCLPLLAKVRHRSEHYDLILLDGVLHHLAPEEQAEAILSLVSMIGPFGRLILSLRHGPTQPLRPGFPTDPDRIVKTAEKAGLRLALRRAAPSVQPENRVAGVSWTWLCLDRG
jgi:SAM-dependent methyltransferase